MNRFKKAAAVCFAFVLIFSSIHALANDIIITLTTTAVTAIYNVPIPDLEVTEPTGEICTKWNTPTAIGGTLSSNGAIYTLETAVDGNYSIRLIANGSESAADEMAQVTLICYEGTDDEIIETFGGPFEITDAEMAIGSFIMPQRDEGPAFPDGPKTDEPALLPSEGCFIATAAFGSYDSPEVLLLRGFRDSFLMNSSVGRRFVNVYYRLSPAVSGAVEGNGVLSALMRLHLEPFIAAADIF